MLSKFIKELVQYGVDTGLTPECERIYTTNLLLDIFHEDEYEDESECKDCCGHASDTMSAKENDEPRGLEQILKDLLDEAVSRGLIEDSVVYRDLFDTRLMNCLMPRPVQVQEKFREAYAVSPEAATTYYYQLSKNSDYIRTYRVKKDMKWTVDTDYGTLDITINLSKPEKDPKAIAAARKSQIKQLSKMSVMYGKRGLCRQSESSCQRKSQNYSDYNSR